MHRDALVVIPCRTGSRRFPDKPLADVDGSPLFYRVWESIRGWDRAVETVVASPDALILARAAEMGIPSRHTLPSHRHGSLRCLQVLMEHPQRDACEWLVNLQGDQTGIAPSMLDALCQAAHRHPGADVVTLACPFRAATDRLDQNRVKVVCCRDGYAHYFSRQPLPGSLRHVGVYLFRASLLPELISSSEPNALSKAEGLEQLEWLVAGASILVVQIDADPLSIDVPQDIMRLRARQKRQHEGEVRG